MSDKQECGVDSMIRLAKNDVGVLGELLERYRAYLTVVARQKISRRVAVLCSPEDIVQQTFLEASKSFERLKGSTEAEFSAWLLRILQCNLIDLARKHGRTEEPSPNLADRLQDPLGSTVLYWREPVGKQSTPSRRAIRGEQALRLSDRLQMLPEMQREAVRMRHLEGRPVAEIASELDKSLAATAGLIKRGLQTLRKYMSEESW